MEEFHRREECNLRTALRLFHDMSCCEQDCVVEGLAFATFLRQRTLCCFPRATKATKIETIRARDGFLLPTSAYTPCALSNHQSLNSVFGYLTFFAAASSVKK